MRRERAVSKSTMRRRRQDEGGGGGDGGGGHFGSISSMGEQETAGSFILAWFRPKSL